MNNTNHISWSTETTTHDPELGLDLTQDERHRVKFRDREASVGLITLAAGGYEVVKHIWSLDDDGRTDRELPGYARRETKDLVEARGIVDLFKGEVVAYLVRRAKRAR